MEKLVIKIGRFIETAAASLLMLSMIPLSKHFPILGFAFFVMSLFLFNELIEEDKEKGGSR